MDQCSICGGELSLFSQKRILDGAICGKCAEKLPRVLSGAVSKLDTKTVSAIIDYEEEMRSREFISVSSLGKLHVDEIHGLFAICDKTSPEGALIGKADVFDCVYLESISLYPVDPKQVKKDVVCDVELFCSYRYPEMQFRVKAAQNQKCEYKQINKTQVSWTEPGTLSMFRNMMDQTIKTSVQRAMDERGRVLRPYDLDIMKARAALHVAEGCTREQIERQYQMLKELYQNSTYPEDERDNILNQITKYYKMLCIAATAAEKRN